MQLLGRQVEGIHRETKLLGHRGIRHGAVVCAQGKAQSGVDQVAKDVVANVVVQLWNGLQ